jgi:hypothetical protein
MAALVTVTWKGPPGVCDYKRGGGAWVEGEGERSEWALSYLPHWGPPMNEWGGIRGMATLYD